MLIEALSRDKDEIFVRLTMSSCSNPMSQWAFRGVRHERTFLCINGIQLFWPHHRHPDIFFGVGSASAGSGVELLLAAAKHDVVALHQPLISW